MRIFFRLTIASLLIVLGTKGALFSEKKPELCVDADFAQAGRVTKARLTSAGVDFCIGLYQGEKVDCYSWDRKQFRRIGEAGIPTAFPDRFLSVKVNGQTLSVCNPQCRKIQVEAKVKLKPDTVVRASSSGRTIIALIDVTKREDSRPVATFASINVDGKSAGTFHVVLEDDCYAWDFLGETLQVHVCVCAGPGCSSRLYDRTGKLLGIVGKGKGREYGDNTFESSEAHYKDDLWLFLAAGSENLTLQDVKTGRVHKAFKLQANDVSIGGLVLTDGKAVWVFPGASGIGQILKVDLAKETWEKAGTLPLCPARTGP